MLDAAKSSILRKYQVSPDAWLGKGMEADVYAYGDDAVLKLYAGTSSLAHLTTLQHFYAALDRRRVPYALPRIHTVVSEGLFVVTLEQRLSGTPMSDRLPSVNAEHLEHAMQRCLGAACALSALPAPSWMDRYQLFDPDGISDRTNGEWHHFLQRYLTLKIPQVRRYLREDVAQLGTKLAQLQVILAQPYQGDYRLIHGDFFPGNLLINHDHQISALLDFGVLTMYGDYLFEIATSWVFFDMYDELKANVRERYLALILATLGEQVRGILYRYVLIYSILSANMYAPNCADGHYRWCVANLNNAEYWQGIA